MLLLVSPFDREHRVVLSNGSWFVVRKVTCGKNNVYWHHPVRRRAAALVSDTTWNGLAQTFSKIFPGLGVPEPNSCVQSIRDYLVVFGDFSVVSAGTRFWEFTGVDGDGNESGPLETPLLDAPAGRTPRGPCILAYGTIAPSKWPIAVRIYERDTNGTRRLLAHVPAKRAGFFGDFAVNLYWTKMGTPSQTPRKCGFTGCVPQGRASCAEKPRPCWF